MSGNFIMQCLELIEKFGIFVYGIFAVLGLCCLVRLFRLRLICKALGSLTTRTLCVYMFFISTMVSFIAEMTLFNYPHYLTFWADEQIVYKFENFVDHDGGEGTKVELKNLNRRITSLRIDPLFTQGDEQHFTVAYKDDDSTRAYTKKIYSFSPQSRYIPIIPHGMVYDLWIIGSPKGVIESIVLNPIIPLKIFVLRMFMLNMFLFAACLFLNKRLRERLKFFLFDYPFDPGNKKQKALYMAMIFSVIAFCFFTAGTTYLFQMDSPSEKSLYTFKGYQLLVDAFMNGNLYLDIAVPPELLNIQRPYDLVERVKLGVEYPFDFVLYNGKYYCYFGVIPALILFLPFKLITNNHLSMAAGVFVFSAFACGFLAWLWREIVRRYMDRMPFFFCFLGGLTLMMCSGLVLLCRRSLIYEVASASALMFIALGSLLFLKSINDQKYSRVKIFFASLSFALAVGCRPTAVLFSFLLPIFLYHVFKSIREKNKTFGARNAFPVLLSCVAVPYAMVAIPLMWYNYARFGSITEFGAWHQLTVMNMSNMSLVNPIGKLLKVFTGFSAYFFNPIDFSSHFPFVRAKLDFDFYGFYNNRSLPVFFYNTATIGLINFPVLWLISTARNVHKTLPETSAILKNILIAMMGIGILQIFVVSMVAGVAIRYSADFMWIFTLSALICAYAASVKFHEGLAKYAVMKIIYLLCFVSIVIEFFLSFTPEHWYEYYFYKPLLYYFKCVFSIYPG
jgi:hypothetical protein